MRLLKFLFPLHDLFCKLTRIKIKNPKYLLIAFWSVFLLLALQFLLPETP